MSRSDRARWLVPVALFALALGVRLVHLWQICDSGFLRQPMSDAFVYDQRASGIAAGDWLGPADFVHAPLYAYVLGVARIITGEGVWTPRVMQAVFGALACVLGCLLGRHLFDRRVGFVAGGMLALYPPAIFFDGIIQKASLTLLLCALLLWLSVRAADRPAWWRWGLVGFVLGLLVLTRQNVLALVPLFIAWAMIGPVARPWRARAGWAGVTFMVTALTMMPWVVRNRVVVGEWTLTTPNLGQNFAMGNHPQATGTYLPHERGQSSAEGEQEAWTRAAAEALGRSLTPGEVSDYYLKASIAWVLENPGRWFGLLVWKTWLVWGAYELPDTEDYYLYQEHASMLWGLDWVLHFGVLCPAALVGLALSLRKWRRLWPLYAWLILTTVAVALFVVFARYRIPLVPVLVLFSAVGFAEVVDAVRRKRFGVLGAAGGVALVGAAVSNWPGVHERRPCAVSYTNHAVALADGGRYETALAELDKALALSPGNADALIVRGSVLLDVERYADALAAFDTALPDDPMHARTHRGRGDALVGLRRMGEATRAYQRSLELDLGHVETWLNLGNCYLATNRMLDAEAAYRRSLALRPGYHAAQINLVTALVRAGRHGEALDFMDEILELEPDRPDLRDLRVHVERSRLQQEHRQLTPCD